MNDNWIDDPWIEFAFNMGEEFFKNHRKTMPENPHDVWDENEVVYFCCSFTLWSAQSKFQLKQKSSFDDRAVQYGKNVQMAMSGDDQIEGLDDSEKTSYVLYKKRELEYIPLLVKGSSSLLSSISGSIFKPACKSFVSHSCKKYIFSERDLIKIINRWLIQKGVEFNQTINFRL